MFIIQFDLYLFLYTILRDLRGIGYSDYRRSVPEIKNPFWWSSSIPVSIPLEIVYFFFFDKYWLCDYDIIIIIILLYIQNSSLKI